MSGCVCVCVCGGYGTHQVGVGGTRVVAMTVVPAAALDASSTVSLFCCVVVLVVLCWRRDKLCPKSGYDLTGRPRDRRCGFESETKIRFAKYIKRDLVGGGVYILTRHSRYCVDCRVSEWLATTYRECGSSGYWVRKDWSALVCSGPGTQQQRVGLWRCAWGDYSSADVFYRSIFLSENKQKYIFVIVVLVLRLYLL